LTTLGTGEFFGDVALLSQGAHCADVIANTNCVLAKLSAAALDKITKGAPDTATPFLRAMDQALTERIRADNQRFAQITAAARQHDA
jgi:CRP-like cAMP-binding protein